jgi:hypothetical protein
MATLPLTDEELRATWEAVRDAGTVAAAARALGIPANTARCRFEMSLARLRLDDPRATARRRLAPPATKPHTMPELPSELPTADELRARRRRQFDRKVEAKEARQLIPVTVAMEGPIGVAIPGDPHLDDDGTDLSLVERHVDIINRTEGLFALGIGDYSNNWVGRLSRLYADQSTSAAEAWVLVEWYVRAVHWLALVGGNHDVWKGDGDPITWMSKSARVTYEAHGVRLGLLLPNGRQIRINARHDFQGKSQYDPAFGVAKAARWGWRDHILVAGHLHISGYHPVKDPMSGLLSHAIRVGSYKTHDRYAEERGLPHQTFTVCPTAIIDPDQPDDSARCITVIFDPEEAADFLTWKRRKWARKRA